MTDVTAETSAPQNDAPAATGFDALKGLGTVSSADEAPVYTQKLDAQRLPARAFRSMYRFELDDPARAPAWLAASTALSCCAA